MSKAIVQAPSIVRSQSFYYRNVTHSIVYKLQTAKVHFPNFHLFFTASFYAQCNICLGMDHNAGRMTKKLDNTNI